MSEAHMREELTEDIFNQCKDLQIRYCDCAEIAEKLIELNYGDTKQAALDFYTAVSLALADGVEEYIIDGKKVLMIKADDMQAYFDEVAKNCGIEVKNG